MPQLEEAVRILRSLLVKTEWHPTPVILPGKSHGQRSLVGCSPWGSHGILQPRTLERVAISFSNAWKRKVKVKLLSRVWLLVTPWTAAYQAPLSMGFSRQEYWSGVPLPSPLGKLESSKETLRLDLITWVSLSVMNDLTSQGILENS